MKVRFLVLIIVSGFLAACTPSIDLPQGFWKMIYATEAARLEAGRDVGDLDGKWTNPDTKKKINGGCYYGTVALYEQASTDWNTLYYTVMVILQSNRLLSAWSDYDAKLEDANLATADFFTLYRATVGVGNRMVTLGKKRDQPWDCTVGVCRSWHNRSSQPHI